MFRLAVVGSGPSGLFLTKTLLRQLKDAVKIDIFERLASPFGLLKYGVAPDHPEVKKKFLAHFDAVFSAPNVSIYGNANIGRDISVERLGSLYDAVILCTGMSDSKRSFNHPTLCYGADQIVGWYNSHPSVKDLALSLRAVSDVVIVGNGNVALDIARILAKRPADLANGEISKKALTALQQSDIKAITVLGRRGPLEASFTPAELREFVQLRDHVAFDIVPEELDQFANAAQTRMQKKNVQILKSLAAPSADNHEKRLTFSFFSPVTKVDPNTKTIMSKSAFSGITSTIPFDLLIECIGFYQKQTILKDYQDSTGKFVTEDFQIADNIFACGWARSGPNGTVADSMMEAEECASFILQRLEHNAHRTVREGLIESEVVRLGLLDMKP